LVRCWRCNTAFTPSWRRGERLCSRECAEDWRRASRRAVRQRGAACLVCATPLNPQARADARFCSARCRQRAFRYLAKKRHFETTRELVAGDMRELEEAWRRARKAKPFGYANTPLADQLGDEMRRIESLFDRRDHRACEHCRTRVPMRRGQKYCSTRCRVAAHRGAVP
jgi:predicted nucleic acid-binding Zn ribbon protein